MSKPYQHPCNDCGGDGFVCDEEEINATDICHTCDGKKNMGLWIKCDVIDCVNGKRDILGGGEVAWTEDCTCTDGKRPLTVAEVEELRAAPMTSENYNKFKGQPVTIAPLEGKV